MAYSAAILARAKARLAAAREQNAQDDAARIGAIYERLPRLRQIDLELQKTAAKVCAAAFRAGEDPSETIRQLKDENLRLQQERDWILESEGVDPDDLEQTGRLPALRRERLSRRADVRMSGGTLPAGAEEGAFVAARRGPRELRPLPAGLLSGGI